MLVTIELVTLLSGTAALSVSDSYPYISALKPHALKRQRCSDGREGH